MVWRFLDKRSAAKGSGFTPAIGQNEPLAEELHMPNNKKLKKFQVYLSFKDKI